MTKNPILDSEVTDYRPDIDGLRAIAVLLVMGYHVFPGFVKGGFIGVDIFFVISGYLITGIILKGLNTNTFSFSYFFMKRIKRIFPALLLVLSCVLVSGWFILRPDELMKLGKHVAAGVTYIVNFTLWKESGYFDSAPELKPLLHLWSLSIEEQFYLIWPLGLFLIYKYKLKLIYFFTIVIALSYALNIAFISKYSETVFYFPFSRFWELLIGGVLAFLSVAKTGYKEKYNNILSFFGVILIFLAVIKLDKWSVFPGYWALLPTFGAALVISAGERSWLNSRILSSKIMVWIGLISYPLYLWHWPIFSFLKIAVDKLPYHLDKIAIVFFSFLLSWITYKYIETPVRNSKKVKKVVFSLLIISLFIGITGLVIYKLQGIPSRLSQKEMPEIIKEMLTPGYGGDVGTDWRQGRCFLNKGEDFNVFASECCEKNKKPVVLLWGDSHAAALYPGLLYLQKKRSLSIVQFTASACAPSLNWDGKINKLCRGINNYTFSEIKKIRPDIVLLAAAWYWSEYDLKTVSVTIDELKKIGIRKIVLIGPVPNWKGKVPDTIVSYYKKFNRMPPLHTDFGLSDVRTIIKIDRKLEAESKRQNIDFISLFKIFCNDDGCMLTTGGAAFKVTSVDAGHLSKTAAEFVFQSIEDKLFNLEGNDD